MTITIEQTYYEPIPTGKYPAKIVAIEEANGQFGPQLKFTFELAPNEQDEGRALYGWASRVFSNQSKLYEWVKAILGGGPIDRSYVFKSDDLINRKVYLVVTEEEGEKGVFNKIQKVLPYNPPAPSPVVTQQPSDDWK